MIELQLLFLTQKHHLLEHTLRRNHFYKTRYINVDKRDHHQLTIKPIDQSAMSRNGGTKIFDLERSFKPRRENTAKRGDDAGEKCEIKCVQQEWVCRYCSFNLDGVWETDSKMVRFHLEDTTWRAIR